VLAFVVVCGARAGASPGTFAKVRQIRVVQMIGDQKRPAAFTIDREGRIFFGERLTGEIQILDPPARNGRPLFTIPNVVGKLQTTQGLLGIALDPHYPARPYVYAYVTREIGGRLLNQVVRVTDHDGTGTNLRVIFSTPGEPTNQGGRILFGPDHMLYVMIGEGHHPEEAQDPQSTNGKILRMTRMGRIPSDNPSENSFVYARGLRNSYGFAFDPLTGNLWETDNGPACNDELNLIVASRNYGWGPRASCDTPPSPPRNTNRDGNDPILPKLWYTPTIAPTGVAFCDSCGLGEARKGDLFFGSFNTGTIHEVTLGANRNGVTSQTIAYQHSQAVLSLETGPKGAIYFSDSEGIYRLKVG
jgi:aldose sugar dehydrogenase